MKTLNYTKDNIATTYFLGVKTDITNAASALSTIRTFLDDPDTSAPRKVFFVNVHSISLALKDPEFRSTLNTADLVLPDGSGLSLAGRIFGQPIIENLNGTDFTPRVLFIAQECGYTVYLFGGSQNVTDRCRTALESRYPSLRIAGSFHGHFEDSEEELIIADINEKHPDILLVALGSPLQEEWISRHASELNVRMCVAVGGLFDFLAGERRRAPLWMRRFGIEWMYRFLQDPRTKWDRVFIEIPLFLLRVARERLSARRTGTLNIGTGERA